VVVRHDFVAVVPGADFPFAAVAINHPAQGIVSRYILIVPDQRPIIRTDELLPDFHFLGSLNDPFFTV
jgi:hypothetical protein